MVLIGCWEMGHMDYMPGRTAQTWCHGPNSAGGVDIRLTFRNDSGKVIKYAYFSFLAFNAVEDVQSCAIKDWTTARLECVGPVQPGATKSEHWENIWYNKNIVKTEMVQVEIEYMDGAAETILGRDMKIETPPPPSPSRGCYVATAVYHSYDCPQVWTLRRFRDNTLAENWYGRAFVRLYYAVSPVLVRWFGETEWFQKLWRGPLDRMVAKLQARGVESTPYEDKPW